MSEGELRFVGGTNAQSIHAHFSEKLRSVPRDAPPWDTLPISH